MLLECIHVIHLWDQVCQWTSDVGNTETQLLEKMVLINQGMGKAKTKKSMTFIFYYTIIGYKVILNMLNPYVIIILL